jgi:hypothetical protein
MYIKFMNITNCPTSNSTQCFLQWHKCSICCTYKGDTFKGTTVMITIRTATNTNCKRILHYHLSMETSGHAILSKISHVLLVLHAVKYHSSTNTHLFDHRIFLWWTPTSHLLLLHTHTVIKAYQYKQSEHKLCAKYCFPGLIHKTFRWQEDEVINAWQI